MRWFWILALVPLTLLVAAVACGGDDDDEADVSDASPTAATETGTDAEPTSTAPATTVGPTDAPTDREVEVVSAGFTGNVGGAFNTFECAFVVHNKSQTAGVGAGTWNVTIFDANDAQIGLTYGTVEALFPDETRGVDSCSGQTSPLGAVPARIEAGVQVNAAQWGEVTSSKRATAEVTELDKSGATWVARGTVTNEFSVALQGALVVVVAFDASNTPIGGKTALVDEIAAGAAVPFEAQILLAGSDNSSIDHVEAFVEPRGMSLQQMEAEE